AHGDACARCRQMLAGAARALLSESPTQPSAPTMALLSRGATVGRFVILELVGWACRATVHAAYDPELDRKVALKLLRADLGGVEDLRARLLREAQAIARI